MQADLWSSRVLENSAGRALVTKGAWEYISRTSGLYFCEPLGSVRKSLDGLKRLSLSACRSAKTAENDLKKQSWIQQRKPTIQTITQRGKESNKRRQKFTKMSWIKIKKIEKCSAGFGAFSVCGVSAPTIRVHSVKIMIILPMKFQKFLE